jgi:GNAT superfamily N-acetyltransferase
LAESNGQGVGFALFFENFSTFLGRPGLYLEDLFVLPEMRRIGIATALFERLFQIARDRDYGRIEWTV